MIEGREIKKLEDCISFIKNGANIKQSKNAAGYPITRIETLSGGKFNRDKMGYADIFELTRYSGYILNDGDVLMSHINSKAYVGRSVVYDKKGEEAIIHGMNLLRIITTPAIKPKYLYFFTLSHQFKKQISSIRKDAVNQSSVAIGDLKKLLVPVPPIAEQEKIVAELDCLTGIIDKKNQQLEELDKLSQSIFYDMFGDPIVNGKGWETEQIEQRCSLKAGKGIKAIELSPEPEEGRFACFGGNGIRGYIRKQSHQGVFPIIGRQGALCGNVVLAQGAFYATEHAVVVSPHSADINPVWLFYELKLLNLNRLAQGVAQPGLSVKELNKVKIILTPLDLQNGFAKKIEAIEKQKERVKQSIVEAETLFNSRMDYWFN